MTENEKKFLDILERGLIKESKMQEIVDKDAVKELMTAAEAMTNTFSFNGKELVENFSKNRLENSYMIHIAIAWIDFWTNVPEYHVDGRNEMSVDICAKIKGLKEFQELCDFYLFGGDAPYESAAQLFAKSSVRMHRTLMQTFSGFIFRYFATINDDSFDKVSQAMIELTGYEDWYRVALI